jgi:DNA-nicking Smr family endonuclease
MLSAILKFFRKIFGITPETSVQPEIPVQSDKTDSQAALVPSPSPEPVKKPIDLAENIRKTQQEKHARRATKRKQSDKKSVKKPLSVLNKSGVRNLSKNDDFAALFGITPGESVDFEEILRQKEEIIEKPLTMRERLKKFPPPIGEIDLHGCTGGQAVIKTDEFIRMSLISDLRTVRIIVGKGLHSEGKAVLRDVVEQKLVDLKKEGLLLSFKWEKTSKLRSGAAIVYLVPNNAKTKGEI